MDMITDALLAEFSKEQELAGLPKDQRFEHFAAYITVRRQHGETFSTGDVVTGKGGDTGIDAFAAIVNGTLVPNVDELEEVAESSAHLDVAFVFVQAAQSPSFDVAKIGNFGYGVLDFFADAPKLKRNDSIEDAAALMRAIYGRAAQFKRGNPSCKLYYVTTGKWGKRPKPDRKVRNGDRRPQGHRPVWRRRLLPDWKDRNPEAIRKGEERDR